MRVLAVGAHPDDLELLCGGILARYAAAGHSVVMCHATTGDRGSYVHSSDKLAEIRLAEARAAAEIIGAQHRTLGLSDAEVSYRDHAQRRQVIDLVRDVRPDVVITHAPNDYMGDHNEGVTPGVRVHISTPPCRCSRPITSLTTRWPASTTWTPSRALDSCQVSTSTSAM